MVVIYLLHITESTNGSPGIRKRKKNVAEIGKHGILLYGNKSRFDILTTPLFEFQRNTAEMGATWCVHGGKMLKA